jgi:hypothetical protein
MHAAENLAAWRTPSHVAGASGVRQRSAPTGGAANGIPLKAEMPDAASLVLASKPPSTRTVPWIAALSAPTKKMRPTPNRVVAHALMRAAFTLV